MLLGCLLLPETAALIVDRSKLLYASEPVWMERFRSVPHTNNRSPSVPKIMNGTAVWQNSSVPQQLLQNGRPSVQKHPLQDGCLVEISHE